jgi:hypothetical protein
VDFRGELGLLKAALLYADRVELVSVGASFMGSLDELGRMRTEARLALMRKLMPLVDPGASPEQLQGAYRLIDSMSRKRLGRRGRLTPDERHLLRFLDDTWCKMQDLVESQFEAWGADDFRVALRSGMLELKPFAATSPEAVLEMGMALGKPGATTRPFADKAYDEYVETICRAIGDGGTYPLFDDLTGDVVGKAVRRGLLSPTPGAKKRGKHGGLSGDLLRRLPLFERASVAEVLEIRSELLPHLEAFREAVAEAAAVIESASWDGARFAEEAELVFREKVAPAVGRIERAVQDDRSKKELSYRYGPLAAVGGASSLGAFLGTGSALAGLAVLAANLAAAGYQGRASARTRRKELEGERLYFYYRAGRMLGRKGA